MAFHGYALVHRLSVSKSKNEEGIYPVRISPYVERIPVNKLRPIVKLEDVGITLYINKAVGEDKYAIYVTNKNIKEANEFIAPVSMFRSRKPSKYVNKYSTYMIIKDIITKHPCTLYTRYIPSTLKKLLGV